MKKIYISLEKRISSAWLSMVDNRSTKHHSKEESVMAFQISTLPNAILFCAPTVQPGSSPPFQCPSVFRNVNVHTHKYAQSRWKPR